METSMRRKLLVSVAAATLSLWLSPAYSQAPDRDDSDRQSRTERSDQGDAADSGRGSREGGAATSEAGKEKAEAEAQKRRERDEQGAASPDASRKRTGEAERSGTGRDRDDEATGKAERRGAAEESETDKTRRGERAQKRSDAQDSEPERAGRAARDADQPQRQEPRTTTRQGDRDATPGETERGRAANRARQRSTTGAAEGTTGATAGSVTNDRVQERLSQAERDAAARGRTLLNAREHERVRRLVDRRKTRVVTRNQFNVTVGAVVPPTVRFYPLPRDVVSIVPQYRGHSFVRVEDEIVIVDPRTRRVVTVLGEEPPPAVASGEGRREGAAPAYGGGRRGRGDAYGYAPRVRLDARQERTLYRGVMSEAREKIRQVCVRVGDRVPNFVELAPVPRNIAAEAPDVERFEYFVLNDQVVLVDPQTREVVDIIDEPR
jgi:hypothetical protein